MKKGILFFSMFIYVFTISAQGGFRFIKEVKKISIPFQLINNLVFIPINVNGVELTFLLDSGVQETILFSLEEKNKVVFKNTEKVTLRGLGGDEAIEGLKSEGNVLDIKGVESRDHLVYIIVDQDFNMSSHIGIPVNGIIGYTFFKDNLIEINYEKKKVVFYKNSHRNRKKIERRFKKVPITIERSKPYLNANVRIASDFIPTKLLVDVGNSDAIWLFQNISDKINVPIKNFDDYLGKGFSGDVEGKRARVSEFLISDFKFSNPIIAFPDSSSIKHITMVPDRVGSVGGEILKRFSVVFDYPNNFLYLKKNKHYFDPFVYNKSGVEIRHSGVQWVKETMQLNTSAIFIGFSDAYKEDNTSGFKYKFQLKPIFEIGHIRKNSAAEKSGLRVGDAIVSINNRVAYKFTLEEINSLLRSEEEKWITVEVERDSQILKFGFQLIDVL